MLSRISKCVKDWKRGYSDAELNMARAIVRTPMFWKPGRHISIREIRAELAAYEELQIERWNATDGAVYGFVNNNMFATESK